MNPPLEQNLEYLHHHASADTLAAIRNPVDEGPDLEVTVGPEGPVFRARGQSSPSIALHSPRRPADEAERQVRRWAANHSIQAGSLIVCLGVGGGFHLPRLAELLTDNGCLLVIDPHPRAVRTALRHIDLPAWLGQRDDVRFVVNHDPESIYQEFLDVIQQRHRIDFSFFTHPGVVRVFHETYQPLPPRLAERVRVDLMQRSTMFNLTRDWLDNAIHNLPRLIDSTPVQRLKGAFAGVPAVVAAAGPSLQECLPLLRDLSRRMLVIAVGTAVRPLLAAGIRPHLVVLVDASPALLRQFEGVDPDSLRLLVPPQIDPDVLRLFSRQLVSFSSCALPEVDDWMDQVGAPADGLRAGGTVTVTAIDAAVYLGCSEVLVFGFDLACRDDGVSHVPRSMWEHARFDPGELIAVPGNTRPTVLTTRQFASYIEVAGGLLARLRKVGAPPIANITSDGARIPNMPHRLPSTVDPTAWPIRGGLDSIIQARCSGKARASRDAVRTALRRVRGQLATFARAAQRASTLCRRATASSGADPSRDRTLLKQEKILTRKNAAFPLLNCALRAESMDALSFLAGTSQKDNDHFEAVHSRCAVYYQTIARQAEWLRERLGAAQDDLAGHRSDQFEDAARS